MLLNDAEEVENIENRLEEPPADVVEDKDGPGDVEAEKAAESELPVAVDAGEGLEVWSGTFSV